MKSKIVFLCAFFVFMATALYADSITLKTGERIEGIISEMSNDWLKIDVNGTKTQYFYQAIERINDEKLELLTLQQKEAVKATPAVSATPIPSATQKVSPTTTAQTALKNITEKLSFKGLPNRQAELAKLISEKITANLPFFAVIMLALYAYVAFCVQLIAKKTEVEPAWLAWVPLANFFLLCRIGGISYLWLLVLLISGVPLWGAVFNAIFWTYAWYKIAIACNKPGWLGLLTIVPFTGIFILPYLAFSKSEAPVSSHPAAPTPPPQPGPQPPQEESLPAKLPRTPPPVNPSVENPPQPPPSPPEAPPPTISHLS